jgi:hypothetical protein
MDSLGNLTEKLLSSIVFVLGARVVGGRTMVYASTQSHLDDIAALPVGALPRVWGVSHRSPGVLHDPKHFCH